MVIKCPNCQHYVSDMAPTCPHCGTILKDDVPSSEITIEREQIPEGSINEEQSVVIPQSNQYTQPKLVEQPNSPKMEESLVEVPSVQTALQSQPSVDVSPSPSYSASVAPILPSSAYQESKNTNGTLIDNEPVSYQPVTYARPESTVNWKKIITIVLCVILVAGLGVGGYFVYTDYAEKKAKEEARLKAEQEEREEQQRLAELEAADWERATVDGTEQGYKRYLEEHADGKHAKDAKEKLAYIEKQRLTDNEVYDVRNIIESFFYNAANGDEEEMLRCLSPTMNNFLGKANASKVDAISFMRRIHADDVYSVNISMDSDDIKVEKTVGDDDVVTYAADFSYDQRLEREDTSLETFASMKGHAVLNESYKITSLTLKKLSSY